MNEKDYDNYSIACYEIQGALSKFVENYSDEETIGYALVDLLGGNTASAFHAFFIPDNREDFKQGILNRIDDVVDRLENPTDNDGIERIGDEKH